MYRFSGRLVTQKMLRVWDDAFSTVIFEVTFKPTGELPIFVTVAHCPPQRQLDECSVPTFQLFVPTLSFCERAVSDRCVFRLALVESGHERLTRRRERGSRDGVVYG